MDILKPSVVWVGGRCYRKNNQVEYTVRTGYTGENEDEDDDHEFVNNQGDEEEIDLQHVVDEFSGGFRASLQVSSNFFPLIIGKGGQIKIRLEKETGTRIVIPRKGLEGDVVVSGTQRHGVVRCCNRIDKMIMSSRHKQPFTHFLSLPVNSNNLQQTFSKFKKEVLDNCSGSRGVEESIFQTRCHHASYTPLVSAPVERVLLVLPRQR
ncbi:activating signal cointegrator 1 complex subunit 1 [Eurytemora carolleeae]|uniref:activating signal cointegrator 1 complex subunit 1 n=1 Tax=Eurytemora carolleeae TaxID=1294199 RepID=UPI000C76485F|nr:activating signal cointegrator 1 complex subunit 1 [Eurytemora carolleeae]|eukprot:XP_023319707.1 activating signal cointegrator 1 complex subunit 1-like [Eurytemora affinis]